MKKIFMIGLIIFWISFPLVLGLSQEQDLISLDFRDIEIGDALRLLAKQYNLNIILSKDITGAVTIQFSNVTVEEAIDSIVTTNGFAYTKLGTVYKVTRPDVAQPTSRLFQLNNAVAKELKEPLKKVLSSVGSIETDERSNSILVTDLPTNLSNIDRLIKGLDNITPQIMIEAKIIETVLGTADKLGIDWTIQATATGAKRPTTAPFEALDPQNLKNYVPYSTPAVSGTVGTFPSIGSGPPLTGFPYSFPYATVAQFTMGTLDASQFKMALELLKSRSKTNLLSSPRITTLNNREAKVVVGKKVPIPIYERNATTGNMEVTGYDLLDVGITLRVKPTVSPDGTIKLELHPEVSSIVGSTGPNGERPIVQTREADTMVQVRDGETVVIGGLISENITDTVKRVPILGYIPILGFPFQKTETTKDKTELLIFVTANILTNKKRADLTYSAMVDSKRKDVFKQDMQDYLDNNKKPLKIKLTKENEPAVEKKKAYKRAK